MAGYDHGTACPCARKLQCTLTDTPHPYGLLPCSPLAPLTTIIEPHGSGGVPYTALTGPRAPAPRLEYYPVEGGGPTTSSGVTRSSSLRRAHAPDLTPLTAYALWLGPQVCAGCCVPLLGRGPSRRSLPKLCAGAWTRTPPRFCGAPARFFPKNFGLTLRARGSAR